MGQEAKRQKIDAANCCLLYRPLLHLSEAGAIHLLQNAGRILISESVTNEYYQNAQGWNPPQWIEVHELDKAAQKRSLGFQESVSVDLGEADAIALAIQASSSAPRSLLFDINQEVWMAEIEIVRFFPWNIPASLILLNPKANFRVVWDQANMPKTQKARNTEISRR